MSTDTAPLPVEEVTRLGQEVLRQVGTVIVGMEQPLRTALAAVLAGGHVLLEDVPGLGKTLAARCLAGALGLEFRRLQCTPDLLPADITGSYAYDPATSEFTFRAGPVFTGLFLADEINRTAPKTQSALLEAMAERQVTVEGRSYPLPRPFHVLATSNPVEYEGTYPLPEAQLDRFLLKLVVGYPSAEQEQEILQRHHEGLDPHDVATVVRPVATAADLAAARAEVDRVTVDPQVLGYLVALAQATRESPSLSLGVSPRGTAMLLHVAKAWAWLVGRPFLTPDEVKAMAKPTLRHRVQVRPEVELEGVTADAVLDGILATVPVPR